jgi:hypothetical protein
MTRDKDWHADRETLDRYLAGPCSEAEAASLEAHLIACAYCRDLLAQHAGEQPALRPRHDTTLTELLRSVDRPRLTLPERLLMRLSVPEHVARVVAAAPALRQAWWVAGTLLLLIAVLIAELTDGSFGTVAFVVTAPVVPLAGVALSYGLHGEPAGQLAPVAPYGSFRIALVRTAVVVASWLPVGLILGALLPSGLRLGALWLLPALALCCLTLALSTVVDPLRAAAVLAVAWLALAGSSVRGPRNMPAAQLLDQFVAFRAVGQASLAAVALVALAFAVTRRSAFDTWSNS